MLVKLEYFTSHRTSMPSFVGFRIHLLIYLNERNATRAVTTSVILNGKMETVNNRSFDI